MEAIRQPAVAGMFYPGSESDLRSSIKSLLNQVSFKEKFENVFGVVSPHAGYTYSGVSAAYAFKVLNEVNFNTAIILSPSHREYFPGVSIYNGEGYKTPLGNVLINDDLRKKIVQGSTYLFTGKEGHGAEHAVEVQLPFLQVLRKDVSIVPIVIGDQKKTIIDELAEKLHSVKTEDTIIIASSDLSHFYSKDIANRFDSIIEEHINLFNYDELQNDLDSNACEACGGGGIVALLKAAKLSGFNKSKVISRTDSGDFSGDNSSVVGYLSAVIYN